MPPKQYEYLSFYDANRTCSNFICFGIYWMENGHIVMTAIFCTVIFIRFYQTMCQSLHKLMHFQNVITYFIVLIKVCHCEWTNLKKYEKNLHL